MNDHLNYYLYRFQTVPFKFKLVILLLLNGLIVFYVNESYIADYNTKTNSLKNVVAQKEQEYNSLMKLKATLPDLQSELNMLTSQLQQKLRKLPNDREIPALLKTVSKEAIKSGLKIVSFEPKEEIPEGSYFIKLPVDVKALGTYHQMAIFCDKVSKLPRIINIVDTSMTYQATSVIGAKLNIAFQIQAFRFQERVGSIVK